MNIGVYDFVVIGATTNMPTVDIPITYCGTIEIIGSTTLSLSANLIALTSFTIDNNAILTMGATVVNQSNPITATIGLLNINTDGSLIELAGVNIQVTGGNITLLNNAYFQNSGFLTSNSQGVSLGIKSHIVNSGEVKLNGSNITMGNDSYINNMQGAKFSMYPSGNTPVLSMSFLARIANDGQFKWLITYFRMAIYARRDCRG